jgi:hypothetical protein
MCRRGPKPAAPIARDSFSAVRRSDDGTRPTLAAQPDIDAAVAGARVPAIARRREESVVTAGRGMRMRAMQIGDAIILAMPVLHASRLIIVEARIVAVSIVRPPFLRRLVLGLFGIPLGLPGIPLGPWVLRLADPRHDRG